MAASFADHLTKQLGFIDRSCQAFDAGHTDEAIRIATSIRVLVHNTQASTSLLKHLGATTIRLLSTTKGASPNAIFYMGLGATAATSTGEAITSKFTPLLDGPTRDFVPVSQWWDQVVFVLNPKARLRRRDIVLAAANKDGGAHVDANLTPEYEAWAEMEQQAHYSMAATVVLLSNRLSTHILSPFARWGMSCYTVPNSWQGEMLPNRRFEGTAASTLAVPSARCASAAPQAQR